MGSPVACASVCSWFLDEDASIQQFADIAERRITRTLGQLGVFRGTKDLRIHLFELPKYEPPSDNRVITDPVEQWLYFFCRAGESTAEELATRLSNPVFAEATGVLEMIAKNPEERRLYNERLKMERDERARNLQAREEGIAEGIAEGFRLGAAVERVQLLRELNGEARGSSEELAALGTAQLAALAQDLQRRLRERQ